jgi:signal transduction histidine kinase/CheY-like chemotaxis protein
VGEVLVSAPSAKVRLGLVGAGKGGAALLRIFLDSEGIEVVGVADPDPAAPGLVFALQRGLPVFPDVQSLFPLRPEILVEATGLPRVREALVRQAPPGVEVIGAASARLLWELVEQRKRMEQELIQHDRLRALGQMAAGIAHEFNNILATIMGQADLLQLHTEDPAVRQNMELVVKAAEDGAAAVRRLQHFYRPARSEEFTPLDLNQVIREVLDLTKSRWRDDPQRLGVSLEIRRELQQLPLILGNPSELREVFINLLFNSLDALPSGGTITVKTWTAEESVFASVVDTGCGMSAEVQHRIFDPFFTTKEGKGSGLGMSIVYGILTRHAGQISIQSAVGQGTTITFRFPINPSLLAPLDQVRAAEVSGGPSGRILVVDDEVAVRRTLHDILAEGGHQVLLAASGEEAIRLFQSRAVDLVVTDLGMPGMNGLEVARALKALSPHTPIALVTGWGAVAEDAGGFAHVNRVLTKPFRVREVLDAVRQLLPHSRTDLSRERRQGEPHGSSSDLENRRES